MAGKVSKSAKWAAGLAVLTLVCAGVAALIIFTPDSMPAESGWGVFMLLILAGFILLLSSIVGFSLALIAVTKRRERSVPVVVGLVVHSLVIGTLASLVIYVLAGSYKDEQKTKLTNAVRQQDIRKVESQLWWRANPDQRTLPDGVPILIVAVETMNKETIGLLLKHGANPNCRRSIFGGDMPLHAAIALARSKSVPETDATRLAIVEMLLKHGADVNATTDGSRTPVYLAAKLGDKTILAMLLEHGADANIKDGFYRTPVYLAAERGDISILTMLAQHGADVNQPCRYISEDLTPLAIAVERRDTKTVLALIGLGANVNAITPDGSTAIYYAKDPNMVDLLCAHGADVNGGRRGFYPNAMGRAVQRNQREVVDALLAHGADVNYRLGNGKTVIEFAIEADNEYMVKLLLDRGADVSSKGEMGSSILNRARDKRNSTIIRMIEDKLGIEHTETDRPDRLMGPKRGRPAGFD